MVKYSNGKIYKIYSDETDLVYYGSTTRKLYERFAEHKIDFKRRPNISIGLLLKDFVCKIVLVEDYPCERKEQLLMRERFYIENNNCINKNIPIETKEERRLKNIELDRIRNKTEHRKEYSRKRYALKKVLDELKI
jgi:hypothetical protein